MLPADVTEIDRTLKALFLDITKRKLRGQRVTRPTARLREVCQLLFFGDRAIQDYPWYMALAHEPEFFRGTLQVQAGLDAVGLNYQAPAEYVPFMAATVWSTAKLFELADTASWFVPSAGLIYKLLATDLRGAVVGDVRLPLPAFYVELPGGLVRIYNRKTGVHEVGALLVAHGEVTGDEVIPYEPVKRGPRLFISMLGEANENSRDVTDDAISYFSISLRDETADIETAMREDTYRDKNPSNPEHLARLSAGERMERDGYIGEVAVPWLEFEQRVVRLVVNLCLYLGAEGSDTRHIHEARIAKLRAKPKRSKTDSATLARLRDDRIYEVGTSIRVDPHIEAHVRRGGKGLELAYRVLVRGHWRNQACGTGRQEHRRIWIHPHVRGSDLPTKIVGHSYEVGE